MTNARRQPVSVCAPPTPADLVWLREWIARHTALRLREDKDGLAAVAAAQRMGARGCETFAEYRFVLEGAEEGEPELARLVEPLTIGETSFYRYPGQFEALRDHVIPELVSNRDRDQPFRVWSAGCATGEEAYTLAMVIRESAQTPSGFQALVVGTDLNERYLESARRGVYPERSLRSLPQEYVDRYFTQSNGVYEIVPELRSMVSFKYLNLASDTYPSRAAGLADLEVIFFRNVCIYFDAQVIAPMIEQMWGCLRGGGHLFLGHSESLMGMSTPFEPVRFDCAWGYRKSTSRSRPASADPCESPRTRPAHPPEAESPLPLPLAERGIAAPAGRERASIPPGRVLAALRSEAVAARAPADVGPGSLSDDFSLLRQALEAADRGDHESAVRLCHASTQDEPCTSRAYSLLAALHRSSGDDQEAIRALRRGLYLDRGSPMLHWQLALVYQQRGEAKHALREYRTALRALTGMPAEKPVPDTDGITYGALSEMARRAAAALETETLEGR